MSPNQPKTPVSNFRFSEETKRDIASIAEAYKTTMTGAIRKATEAMVNLNHLHLEVSARYPFDAYTAALRAFRDRMGYEEGQILPEDAVNAVDCAIIAANPIIREAQHYETLRDVVARLKGFGVDPDVVNHFQSLLPEG